MELFGPLDINNLFFNSITYLTLRNLFTLYKFTYTFTHNRYNLKHLDPIYTHYSRDNDFFENETPYIRGYIDVIRLLFNDPLYDFNKKYFCTACRYGNLNVVKFLYKINNELINVRNLFISTLVKKVTIIYPSAFNSIYVSENVSLFKLVGKNVSVIKFLHNCKVKIPNDIHKYLVETMKNFEIFKFIFENCVEIYKRVRFIKSDNITSNCQTINDILSNKRNTILNHMTREAIYGGYYDIVVYLFEKYTCAVDSSTAIHFCVSFDYLHILKYLHNKGFNLHYKNDQSLITAIECNNLNIVKYLCKNKSDIHTQDNEAIKMSLKCNNINIFAYLYKKGCVISLYDIVKHSNYNVDVVRLIKRYVHNNITDFDKIADDSNNALLLATKNNNLKLIKYLNKNFGVDFKYNNNKAVCMAASCGYIDIVKYYCKYDIDIFARDNFTLRSAVLNGHYEIVKYLLKIGSNIHVKNNWIIKKLAKRPLLIDMFKFIYKCGVDIYCDNNLALYTAIKYENTDAINLLHYYDKNKQINFDLAIKTANKLGKIKSVECLNRLGFYGEIYYDSATAFLNEISEYESDNNSLSSVET